MEMALNMVEVFKTNVQQKKQARKLFDILSTQFPLLKINFDLEDCDKILRVEGQNIPREKIVKLLSGNGYRCEVLD
jgi:hypothetical protein